jgi:hypothetical protein
MVDEGAWGFDLPLGGNIRSAVGDPAVECVVFHDGLPLASVLSTSLQDWRFPSLGCVSIVVPDWLSWVPSSTEIMFAVPPGMIFVHQDHHKATNLLGTCKEQHAEKAPS